MAASSQPRRSIFNIASPEVRFPPAPPAVVARSPAPSAASDAASFHSAPETGSPSPRSPAASAAGSDHGSDTDDDFYDTNQRQRWGDHRDNARTVAPYRQLLAGVEWEHHTALSAHLYNAFRIKAADRDRKPKTPGSSLTPESSDSDASAERPRKRRKTSADFIRPQWTAWPMPFADVPSAAEHHPRARLNVDREPSAFDPPLPPPPEPTPAEFLKECITAEFLRQAKPRIRADGLEPADDDEKAAALLKPMVNSVVSRLDELLAGLAIDRMSYADSRLARGDGERPAGARPWPRHRRKSGDGEAGGHTAENGGEAAEEENQGDDGGEGEDREYLGLPDTGLASGPQNGIAGLLARARKTKHRPSTISLSPALRIETEERRKRAEGELHPRDWSQLLGIAQLRAWGDVPVQVAAERCAGLFNQDMSWRTLGERKDDMVEYRSLERRETRLKKSMRAKRERDRVRLEKATRRGNWKRQQEEDLEQKEQQEDGTDESEEEDDDEQEEKEREDEGGEEKEARPERAIRGAPRGKSGLRKQGKPNPGYLDEIVISRREHKNALEVKRNKEEDKVMRVRERFQQKSRERMKEKEAEADKENNDGEADGEEMEGEGQDENVVVLSSGSEEDE